MSCSSDDGDFSSCDDASPSSSRSGDNESESDDERALGRAEGIGHSSTEEGFFLTMDDDTEVVAANNGSDRT